LRENYLKALYIISVSSGILMAIIYLIFKNYTLNIFGESWVGIIDLIPIFAFVGWLSTLYSVNSIYYQATGIPKIGVKFTLIRFVTTLIFLFPLVNIYEVKGLVLALLTGLLVTLIFIFNDISKRIRTPNVVIVRELFAGMLPALILIAILQIVNIESLAIGILLIFFMGILSTTIFYKKIKLSLDF
jgi:O-antigen/teichoic acid export membrane protein